MKHTSGPWRWSKLHQNRSLQIVGPLDELICELHYHEKTNDNNTDIIAAAPEMFELLRAIARDVSQDACEPPFWKSLVALIDKIENSPAKTLNQKGE